MLNLIAKKTGEISATLLVCAFLFLAPSSQAEVIPGSASFDHSKTGFLLRDIHTSLRCEQCHVDGIFKNTPKDCAGCHAVGTRVGATPKPDSHVPTNRPCDTCHISATNFLVKSFSHPGISGKCATCHNGQYSGVVSKGVAHFPTSMPCETCHTNLTTFSSWRMDHVASGITDRCALCHSGQFPGVSTPGVSIKSPTHVVTTKSCEVCHSSFSTFFGAHFDHSTNPTPVAGICSNCHGGALGVTAKPVTHFPTTAQCDTCHTQSNTSNYLTFAGITYSHSAADNGRCSTCHNGSFPNALGKPLTHVQTTAQCDTCHTQTNTSNYSTFLGGSYTHASPPGACSTCHNGAMAKGKPSVHIITSDECSICHTQANTTNYTTFLGATYTHPNPPGVCATCHNGTQATGKPVYHIPTTAACDSSGCHSQSNTSNYTTFFGVVYVHTAPIGVCATCHNGTSAKGKSATHVATNAACDTCHTASNTSNYSTFLGATYQHPTPPGVCSTCHNGATAQGKVGPKAVVPAHIITTSECSVCHTQANTANYTTFLGATYAHANPPGVCATCHNGSIALGKHALHIATTLGCDSCHTQSNTSNYTTFKGATGAVDHATIVPAAAGSCQRSGCHNGVSAKGLPASGHIPLPASAASCDSGGCHTYVGGTFAGAVMNNTPGHAAVVSARCDSCHNGAYTTQGTLGAYGKVGNHIPTTITGGLDCNTCHTTTSYTSLANWLTERMNHNGAQGGGVGGNGAYCVTCHLKGVSYLGTMDKKSHEGTSMAKDCSKSGCHRPLGNTGTTYVNWN